MQKYTLPLIALSLNLMGLVTLASVSPDLMRRQLIFSFISFIVFWIVSQFSLRIWWSWGEWLWKTLTFILLALLVFGRATRGSVAWVDLGFGLRFQPSQFALLAMMFVTLPQFFKRKMLRDAELVKLLWLIGAPAILILLQPDFGTVFLYTIAASVILFWQKMPKQYWRFALMSVLAASLIGWSFILKPYQQARITSFFSGAQADQSSTGYNTRQALIAVGSGQLSGRGLGHGTQSQLRFLPERQTDFIFASLAEEWGLVGSLVVIALYTYLLYFLLHYATRLKDAKKSLFLIITAVYLLAQTFINIGMNIGLLPITGVTLPLVSYGGSSLLSTMILLGIAQRIILQANSHRHLRFS